MSKIDLSTEGDKTTKYDELDRANITGPLESGKDVGEGWRVALMRPVLTAALGAFAGGVVLGIFLLRNPNYQLG